MTRTSNWPDEQQDPTLPPGAPGAIGGAGGGVFEVKSFPLLTIWLLLLLHAPTDGWAQPIAKQQLRMPTSGASQLVRVNSMEEVRALAAKDIENGLVVLILNGGIAPRVFTTDSAFQAKYQVYFLDEGCVGSGHDKVVAYNLVVFEHLSTKYGSAWWKEVRDDVIGLKTWKKSQKKSWFGAKTNRE